LNAVFVTERLCFRLPELEDVAEIVRYFQANRDHLQPWEPTFHPAVFSEAFWRDQVGQRRTDYEAGRQIRGFLYPIDGPAAPVGHLSLTQIVRGAMNACTLGYALAADAQGHGYMLEAVRSAVGHAFGELGLHRVMASYMPRNRRSAAVLRRAGFVVEGYARSYLLINGRWEDHIMTAVTNPGWTR
jgi:ribosomal-protein-alanine N-acetyltransferase